jgi:hypothetical protein
MPESDDDNFLIFNGSELFGVTKIQHTKGGMPTKFEHLQATTAASAPCVRAAWHGLTAALVRSRHNAQFTALMKTLEGGSRRKARINRLQSACNASAVTSLFVPRKCRWPK